MKYIRLLPVMLFASTITIHAGMVPFTEDPYTMQASGNIVALAQRSAAIMNFEGTYEVVEPKKAGIEINPWNKFIGHGVNPQTQNNFIVVNAEWFKGIPEDQQLFLLCRSFAYFKEGSSSSLMRMLPYIFIFFGWIFLLLLYWLLGKTRLAYQQKKVRFFVAWLVLVVGNMTFIGGLQTRVMQYVAGKHNVYVLQTVLEKIDNKDAAVKALRYFGDSVIQEIKNGETAFVPFSDLFEGYAKFEIV